MLLDDLNESQREAVEYCEGPSLVIAGAGSGKTRVLTYKIAYLLQKGLPASSILALTFTNKAAREMKERIASLVGEKAARHLWMGTFHAIFGRILRAEADKIGYTKDFTIYDTADTKNLLKTIVKQMQLDEKLYKPATLYGRISNAKNSLMSPKAYSQNRDVIQADQAARLYRMAEIYAEYVRRCKIANAMDFDDLLYNTNILFRDFPAVLATYQARFSYILVDEYQDTNFSQYLIVKKLTETNPHICVVGDDAQSIYAFRGASIKNILSFRQTYPNAQLFKLERNYRSTKNIVEAANSLIAANKEQIPKSVYSEKEMGEPLHIFNTYTDIEEGTQVANEIVRLRKHESMGYNDIAILYRTNAQSRVLEDALRAENIPYRIYGGHSFYQRKEIKDAIAYMRLVVNHNDDESLKRIINVPARGIGDTTLNKVLSTAQLYGVSAWEILKQPLKYNLAVNAGTLRKLDGFSVLISTFTDLTDTLGAYELAEQIIKQSGLAADALADKTSEGMSRHENLMEMLAGIHEMDERRQDAGEDGTLLTDFLAEVSLLTDQDEKDDNTTDKITLMTVHAAKGLEFRAVFIVGVEEGLFPSQFSSTDSEVEEERRLFYVAITRAEELCYISYAQSRFRNGKTNFCTPSRFVYDIADDYLDNPPNKHKPRSFEYDFDAEKTAWNSASTTSRPAWRETQVAQLPPQAPPPRNLSKTGGTYLKGDKQLVNCGFTEGQTVRHGVFGTGTVLSTYLENGNQKIDIDFEKNGKKSLLIKFAKLEKVD